MGSNSKPVVAKEAVQSAENLWQRFTHWTKISVIAVIIVMALMALFLV